MKQGARSVGEYTEKFLDKAKWFNLKSADVWCRWYKVRLRWDIHVYLIGVLEPFEFYLVKRMVGQVVDVEKFIVGWVVDI